MNTPGYTSCSIKTTPYIKITFTPDFQRPECQRNTESVPHSIQHSIHHEIHISEQNVCKNQNRKE